VETPMKQFCVGIIVAIGLALPAARSCISTMEGLTRPLAIQITTQLPTLALIPTT
jgi:hypothetical protein